VRWSVIQELATEGNESRESTQLIVANMCDTIHQQQRQNITERQR